MAAFGIPDGDAELGALAIDGGTRLDAWATAAEQAQSADAIAALEERLYRRLELLRKREAPPDVERAALAMLAARRDELRAGTGGNRGPMKKD